MPEIVKRLVRMARGAITALLYAAAALVPFLFALRLLGTAAEAAAPQLQRVFESIGGGRPFSAPPGWPRTRRSTDP